MKRIAWIVLYTGLMLGANAAAAADLAALRQGQMRALVVHDTPQPLSRIAIETPAGEARGLDHWAGQVVVLNFWATWCPPCRKEMPGLDRIAAEYAGRGLVVLPVATGRNSLAGIERFYAEAGITALPILLDPRSGLARASGVMGLPVTLLLDREGREVARLTGEADWAGPEARAVFDHLLAGAASGPVSGPVSGPASEAAAK